jgi:hypothetical protein
LATLIGLGFVSAALLHLEITLTKIFSVVLWYHFGFLAIGMALLGFAVAGVYLTHRPEKLTATEAPRSLGRFSLYATAGIFFGFLLLTHSQFDTFSIVREKREALFLVYCLEAALPFFLLGLVVAGTLSAYPERVGSLYAANLTGSAIGCLTAVAALNHLTGQQSAMVAAVLAGAGALAYGVPAGRLALARNLVLAALVGLVGLTRADTLFRLLPQPSKIFANVPPVAVEVSDWSSLSKVDIVNVGDTHQGLWGISKAWDRDPWFVERRKAKRSLYPPRKGILIDEWAITSMLNPEGPISPENPKLTFLKYLPAGAVHRIKKNADVVCIGAGGGLDLVTALYYGQKRAVGVEINRLIVEAVRGERYPEKDYAGFSGGLCKDSRVQMEVAEGRHFLERSTDRFDIVQLSGVDTHSATEAGAFSLAENFLYTVEAFKTYLERLKPGGVVTLTRWMLLRKGNVPTSSLRLFVLAWEGLRAAGVEDPAPNIYFFRSGLFTVILLKMEPFSPEEIRTLDGLLEAMLYDPLYRPGHPSTGRIALRDLDTGHEVTIEDVYSRYKEASRKGPAAARAFLASYPFDVSAPTDDRPFFFEHYRFSQLGSEETLFNPLGGLSSHATLALLFLFVVAAGFLFVFLPARALASGGVTASVRRQVGLYFGAIGLAYLLVEIPLSQQFILFLGQPVYALTVILFSLLVFSGIGSWFAGRLPRPGPRPVMVATAVVAALTVLYCFGLTPVLRALLGMPLPLRVAVSVGLLAPLGFLMGFPFPLGIRLLSAGHHGSAVPWAWAMNGYASVLSAVGAVILGITLGFDAALFFAAALYLAAGVLSRMIQPPGASVGQSAPTDTGVTPPPAP